MKKLFAIVLLALAGCSTSGQTPQQAVFAAKGAYEVALTTAVAYRNLPTCSATVKFPCSNLEMVAQLQRSQPPVRTALDSAEAVVRNPNFGNNIVDSAVAAAEAALKAFVSITSTLKVK